jgi:hypothetical protein
LHKQSSMQACDMMKFKISFHNLWSELFFCLNYVSGVVEFSYSFFFFFDMVYV